VLLLLLLLQALVLFCHDGRGEKLLRPFGEEAGRLWQLWHGATQRIIIEENNIFVVECISVQCGCSASECKHLPLAVEVPVTGGWTDNGLGANSVADALLEGLHRGRRVLVLVLLIRHDHLSIRVV
jgi:hypothetical protein